MPARPTIRAVASGRWRRPGLALAVLALALGGCAAGPAAHQFNDTGGIIASTPWTDRHARAIAAEGCGEYGKAARITSRRRMYGAYITYRCHFTGPLRRNARGFVLRH